MATIGIEAPVVGAADEADDITDEELGALALELDCCDDDGALVVSDALELVLCDLCFELVLCDLCFELVALEFVASCSFGLLWDNASFDFVLDWVVELDGALTELAVGTELIVALPWCFDEGLDVDAEDSDLCAPACEVEDVPVDVAVAVSARNEDCTSDFCAGVRPV